MANNYVETPELPSRIGYEIAGMVEAVGAKVTEFKVGARVSAIPAFSISDYANFGESVVLRPFLLEASVPGIFAAGDVRYGSIRRVASGVGKVGSQFNSFIATLLRFSSRRFLCYVLKTW